MGFRLAVVFLVLGCASLDARPMERMRRWEELAATISNERIGITLPDGTRLHGVGRGTDGEEMVMDVRRSSNRKLHATGQTRIPRREVLTIDLYLRRGPEGQRGGAIGAGIGAAVTSAPAFYLGQNNHGPLAAVVLAAGIVAGGVIGHKLFDRDSVDSGHIVIQVVPKAAVAVP